MKRKNWTHDVRHAKHLLVRERLYLPSPTSPAYSNRTAEEADRLNLAISLLSSRLCGIKSAASNGYWMRVNLRWFWLRQRLQSYQVRASALRALEQISAARESVA